MSEGHGPRRANLGPQVLALLVFVVALWTRSTDVMAGMSGADGANLVIAKALAAGDGFRYSHLATGQPAAGHAPLYPVVLSLVWRVWPAFPENLALVHILSSAVWAITSWTLAVCALRLDVPHLVVYPVVFLAVASVPMLRIVSVPSAEPLLLLTATAAIWVGDRTSSEMSGAIIAGCLAACAALSARWGGILIIAVALGFAAKGAWRCVGASAGVGLAVVLGVRWLLWGTVVAGPVGEVVLTDPASLLGFHSDQRLSSLLLGGSPTWLFAGFMAMSVTLATWGGISVARSAPSLVGAVVLAGLAAPLGFPATKWVVLPWMFILSAVGAVRIVESYARLRWPALVMVALAGAVYVFGLGSHVPGRAFLQAAADASAPYRLVTTSITAETPDSAVIAAERDALVALYSKRRTAWYEEGSLESGATIQDLCRGGATYLLAESRWPEGAATSVTAMFRLTNGPALYRLECAGF